MAAKFLKLTTIHGSHVLLNTDQIHMVFAENEMVDVEVWFKQEYDKYELCMKFR